MMSSSQCTLSPSQCTLWNQQNNNVLFVIIFSDAFSCVCVCCSRCTPAYLQAKIYHSGQPLIAGWSHSSPCSNALEGLSFYFIVALWQPIRHSRVRGVNLLWLTDEGRMEGRKGDGQIMPQTNWAAPRVNYQVLPWGTSAHNRESWTYFSLMYHVLFHLLEHGKNGKQGYTYSDIYL